MILLKRVGLILSILLLLMVNTVYANEPKWEDVPGHHNQSILLSVDETTAQDAYYTYARGDYLSGGMTVISNLQNGNISIIVDTYAHRGVDRIFHTVFLDQWDAESEDWIPVENWSFEEVKENVDGDLTVLATSFTAYGYETNKYYRLRGLHGVELNDEIEACASETNGVLITDGPT